MKSNETATSQNLRTGRWLACGLALLFTVASTGCQITEGGQLLPSPYYLDDDVQLYSHGPEMILSEEATRLKAARTDNENNIRR